MNIYNRVQGKQPAARGPAVILAVLMLAGCHVKPPEPPPPGSYGWMAYTHPTLGYRVDYPDVYEVNTRGDGDAVFAYDGRTAFRLVYATEEESATRGLWGKHRPVEEVTIGGRRGQRYVYDHWDGPSYVHTIAFAVPHREKLLGVEFRTDAEALDDVQHRVLQSITFLP